MSERGYVYHDHPRPFCGEGCPAYGESPLIQRYRKGSAMSEPRTAHQYLHDEGVWPDEDEAWHERVCENLRYVEAEAAANVTESVTSEPQGLDVAITVGEASGPALAAQEDDLQAICPKCGYDYGRHLVPGNLCPDAQEDERP